MSIVAKAGRRLLAAHRQRFWSTYADRYYSPEDHVREYYSRENYWVDRYSNRENYDYYRARDIRVHPAERLRAATHYSIAKSKRKHSVNKSSLVDAAVRTLRTSRNNSGLLDSVQLRQVQHLLGKSANARIVTAKSMAESGILTPSAITQTYGIHQVCDESKEDAVETTTTVETAEDLRVRRNPELLQLLKIPLINISLITLNPRSLEFDQIYTYFMHSNRSGFVLIRIEKVHNPILEQQFVLKVLQNEKRYGRKMHQRFLFHGTTRRNVDDICRYNFNWRMYGLRRGFKFGKGVCFSQDVTYASHYGDKSYRKVMIMARVMLSMACLGDRSTNYPDEPFDSTRNDTGQVLVKYEDNEFLPQYVIHYEGFEDV